MANTLKTLKDHFETIREEFEGLPDVFIHPAGRKQGDWEDSPHLREIMRRYVSGQHGWLKGWTDCPDEWYGWPLIWKDQPVLGNCKFCPKTYEILKNTKGVRIAGFSLMKGGVKLPAHTDNVSDTYVFTYHLGVKCPEGSILYTKDGPVVEEDGKHIVFDARNQHWAENKSNEDRIILHIEYHR